MNPITIQLGNIGGINPVSFADRTKAVKAVDEKTGEESSFSDMFNNALSQIATTDYEDKLTNVGLMTGTLDNLHTATIAAEKSDIVLNLAVQIRNRMVEGYQEVMRMQM